MCWFCVRYNNTASDDLGEEECCKKVDFSFIKYIIMNESQTTGNSNESGKDWKDQAEEKIQELKGKAGELADKAEDKLEELKDLAENKFSDLKGKADVLADKAEDKFEELKDKAEDVMDELKEKAGSLWDQLTDKLGGSDERAKQNPGK
mgnify:CR=1 FL=1